MGGEDIGALRGKVRGVPGWGGAGARLLRDFCIQQSVTFCALKGEACQLCVRV